MTKEHLNIHYDMRKPRVSLVHNTVSITTNLLNGDTLFIRINDFDDAYRIGREIIDAALAAASKSQEDAKSSSSSTDKASQSPPE